MAPPGTDALVDRTTRKLFLRWCARKQALTRALAVMAAWGWADFLDVSLERLEMGSGASELALRICVTAVLLVALLLASTGIGTCFACRPRLFCCLGRRCKFGRRVLLAINNALGVLFGRSLFTTGLAITRRIAAETTDYEPDAPVKRSHVVFGAVCSAIMTIGIVALVYTVGDRQSREQQRRELEGMYDDADDDLNDGYDGGKSHDDVPLQDDLRSILYRGPRRHMLLIALSMTLGWVYYQSIQILVLYLVQDQSTVAEVATLFTVAAGVTGAASVVTFVLNQAFSQERHPATRWLVTGASGLTCGGLWYSALIRPMRDQGIPASAVFCITVAFSFVLFYVGFLLARLRRPPGAVVAMPAWCCCCALVTEGAQRFAGQVIALSNQTLAFLIAFAWSDAVDVAANVNDVDGIGGWRGFEQDDAAANTASDLERAMLATLVYAVCLTVVSAAVLSSKLWLLKPRRLSRDDAAAAAAAAKW